MTNPTTDDRRIADRRVNRGHRKVEVRMIAPILTLITILIVAGFFQLDRVSDARAREIAQVAEQRADDLEAAAAQRTEDAAREAVLEAYRDCVDLALIETKLRDLFVYINERFPESMALQELQVGVEERFPAKVEDCSIPPDD